MGKFTRFFVPMLASMLIAGVAACNNGNDGGSGPAPTLKLNPDSLLFRSTAGDMYVRVTGSDWSASSDAPWVTVAPASGMDGDILTVSVAANNADLRSATVTVSNGSESKTVAVTQAESRLLFTHARGGLFQDGSYYGHDKTNSIIDLYGFDPDRVWDGWFLTMNVISALADMSMPVLDVSGGTYTFAYNASEVNSVDLQYDTRLIFYEDGNPVIHIIPDNEISIAGGTMSVSGDHTGYEIKIDLELSNGEPFRAAYSGPISIDNPAIMSNFTEDQDFGNVAIADMVYYNSPFPTSPVDMFLVHGYSSDVSVENGMYKGDGWAFITQLHTPQGGGMQLPEGTYNIANSLEERVALGGYLDMMGNSAGTWVLMLEEGIAIGEAPLLSGTITSRYSGGDYTITIDGVDDAGNAITGTASGAVTVVSYQ